MGKAEKKRKNCLNCNKSLTRADWYYKNSDYFCNKSCFKSNLKKKESAQTQ